MKNTNLQEGAKDMILSLATSHCMDIARRLYHGYSIFSMN